MDDFVKLLLPDSDEKFVKQPLEAIGFRFAPTKNWCIVTRFHDRLPKNWARNRVAEPVGVSEQLLEHWEKVIRDQDVYEDKATSPVNLLCVDRKHFSKDSINAWRLRYYPQSKVWRRIRSHRSEVSRSEVGTKIGLPEGLIFNWELAMHSAWHFGEG